LFHADCEPISWAAIAKVCLTDSQTVETIVREVFSKFSKQVKDGKDVKLNLRFGSLSVKNGLATFTPSK
jgi:nucleoid DNA-binding protein